MQGHRTSYLVRWRGYTPAGRGSLFEPDTSRIKFLKPGFAPSVLDIADERLPGMQQRVFVSFDVASMPSIFMKKHRDRSLLQHENLAR